MNSLEDTQDKTLRIKFFQMRLYLKCTDGLKGEKLTGVYRMCKWESVFFCFLFFVFVFWPAFSQIWRSKLYSYYRRSFHLFQLEFQLVSISYYVCSIFFQCCIQFMLINMFLLWIHIFILHILPHFNFYSINNF